MATATTQSEFIIVGQCQGTGYTLWDIAPAPIDLSRRNAVIEELGVDAADAFGAVNTVWAATPREAIDNFLADMREQSGFKDYGLTADSRTDCLDEPAGSARVGVISDGILTQHGNPFNLKYAVLAAQPDDVLEEVTTPNYMVGATLYRTGLVVDFDQRGLGVAWPAEQNNAGQGRAMVRATTETAAVIHATVSPGLDSFTLDGIAHDREARDRVRAAILNSGYSWPLGRITVTVETVTGRFLDSTHDLAIACAILGAAGHYPPNAMTEVALIGELGLDGQVRPVLDVNNAARAAIAAGCTTALIPDANMSDIDVADIGIYSVENVDQAVRVLQTFDRANS